nr:hypothetical protein SHINE37_42677 [Rhizobiaceae bacterium]
MESDTPGGVRWVDGFKLCKITKTLKAITPKNPKNPLNLLLGVLGVLVPAISRKFPKTPKYYWGFWGCLFLANMKIFLDQSRKMRSPRPMPSCISTPFASSAHAVMEGSDHSLVGG